LMTEPIIDDILAFPAACGNHRIGDLKIAA
jgi:hypothetical protein